MMIDIIVAEDHTIMRAGLKNVLAEQSDIRVVGEVTDSSQIVPFLKAVDQQANTVLLLNITIPGCDGLDLLRRIRAVMPQIPLLAFGMNYMVEEQLAYRALKAGAQGYLFKDNILTELPGAIRKVARNGRYISSSLAERLAQELFDSRTKNPHEALSDREYEVLLQLASGKTATRIANELALSVKTISTYRCRILRKMHMDNNAQLVCYALQNNIITNI